MRPYLIALLCVWTALFVAALYLRREHPHSHWIMTAALPALLLEAVFYLGAMCEQTRSWFARIRSGRTQGAMLWIAALLPYLVFSLSAGTFQRNAFYLLAVLCGVFSFWYVYTPRRAAYDIGFLVIAAAPIVERVFARIYQSPEDHLRVDILGHLMWIRLGVMALLVLRAWDPGVFGLWPDRSEWKAGFLWYAAVLIPIIGAAMALHDVRFAPLHDVWWRIGALAAGTFFGMLWVVALGEELFFRGVIERALWDQWASRALAVVVSALLFGAAHLWFHQFPDWRRAIVAAILGVGCGIAYVQTGSVRAPMVTHALVVTTWRVFFK
jgi:membrane protease YdiL (CAAX protease family)